MASFINSKAGKTAASGTTVTNPVNKYFDALDPKSGKSANLSDLEKAAKAAVQHITDKIQTPICPELVANMKASVKALSQPSENTASVPKPKNT